VPVAQFSYCREPAYALRLTPGQPCLARKRRLACPAEALEVTWTARLRASRYGGAGFAVMRLAGLPSRSSPQASEGWRP
jgi:hypothetical protein